MTAHAAHRSDAGDDPDHRRHRRRPPPRRPRAARTPGPPATGSARRCSRPSSRWCGSLHGLRFLDLYAGSGAVGLEAWSRGAGVVTLVEQDRRTAALIADNARTIGFPRANVVAAPVTGTLRRPPAAPYDVVFLDPPYPLPDAAVDDDLLAARRPRLAGAGRAGGRRALGAQRRARLAGGDRRRPPARSTARPCFGTVTRPSRPHARSGDPDPSPGVSVRRAVCPGSFDPVTNGHIDIIAPGLRALRRGRGRGRGEQVQEPPLRGRRAHRRCCAEACAGYDNVSVDGFTGLLTTFCQERGIPRSSRACAR